MTTLEQKQLERRVEDLEMQLKLIREILSRMAQQEVTRGDTRRHPRSIRRGGLVRGDRARD
jgi:hypothetical protein